MRYFLIVAVMAIATTSSIHCFGKEASHQNTLNEVMLGGKNHEFEKQDLESSSVIYSYKVTTLESSGIPCHMGYYIGSQIVTYLNPSHEDFGKQSVTFSWQRMDNGAPVTSHSTNWCVKTIKGKKYILHIHDCFRVYSNRESQYVVIN